MMLAFTDWSSTLSPGTHHQVGAIFQMLPYRSYSVVETHIHELLAMCVTAISFTTDICTRDVRPMSMLSLTAQLVDSPIACSRMCRFSYRCCHFNVIWEHEHIPSSTTDLRNKLINCVCCRHFTLCHGIEHLLNKTADLQKYSRLWTSDSVAFSLSLFTVLPRC